MPESTLVAAFTDLQSAVGFHLGFGRGEEAGDLAWDVYQQRSIDACTAHGQRRIYECGYKWSWLQPVATLTLASGAVTVALPADFGGKEGEITISTSGAGNPQSLIEFGLIGLVYRAFAENPTSTGRPQLAAVEWLRGTTTDRGQRAQLRLWPTADQEYTLQFPYYLIPDATNGQRPYVYGGARFSQMFIDACLTAAELDIDGRIAEREATFQRSLAEHMAIDATTKPSFIGLNTSRERSTHYRTRRQWHGITGGQLTVNGQEL